MSARRAHTPHTVMVWALTDSRIEDTAMLRADLHDIAEKGFEGVAAFVRCSRYMWTDAAALRALYAASSYCCDRGLAFWFGADPRLAAPKLQSRAKPLHILAYGAHPSAAEPLYAPVTGGRFLLSCSTTPRPTHILPGGAVHYTPLGLERVYALRAGVSLLREGRDVVDITTRAHVHHNVREGRVEAFGRWDPPDSGAWEVLVFFRFETNQFDYSNPSSMARYLRALESAARAGIRCDAVLWDEPGYGCAPCALALPRGSSAPFGVVRNNMSGALWRVAREADDGSHAGPRSTHARVLQETVDSARAAMVDAARRIWGRAVMTGMHDTWRWESADMTDMRHGSMDLWRAAQASSGGFVDLGSAQLLADPDSPFRANLAAMLHVGTALGRRSTRRCVYNNLWVSDGAGTTRALDACVDAMAAFGHGWMAHIYGPAGVLGDEDSFLGLPFTPGYPRHGDWPRFTEWTQRLRAHHHLTGGALPEANVLLAFPIESLYAAGPRAASAQADVLFRLILALADAHYLVDVAPEYDLAALRSRGARLALQGREFDAVITTARAALPRAARAHDPRVIQAQLPAPGEAQLADNGTSLIEAVLRALEALPAARRVSGPRGSWITLTRTSRGLLATLCAARPGTRYGGLLRVDGATIRLPRGGGLRRVLFDPDTAHPVEL
ncbi:MAG: hypothetical protein HY962_12785 [Ignavibacteriae bacterium]|nr:hypothetical protein [Ignavibacteriota bacterium]